MKPTFTRVWSNFDKEQIALWEYLLKSRPVAKKTLEDGSVVFVKCDTEPCFAEDIFRESLFNTECSLFQEIVGYMNVPRIASAIYKNDVIVGHAILMPTVAPLCGSLPVQKETFGVKLGLLGAYVSRAYRGNGYANACIQGMSSMINSIAKESNHLPKCCVMSEKEAVSLYQPYLDIPVLVRKLAEDESVTPDYAKYD